MDVLKGAVTDFYGNTTRLQSQVQLLKSLFTVYQISLNGSLVPSPVSSYLEKRIWLLSSGIKIPINEFSGSRVNTS